MADNILIFSATRTPHLIDHTVERITVLSTDIDNSDFMKKVLF